ncbi:MAG: glycosyltransferase family A protein [Pseudomonadota bacterium]
MPRLSVVMSVFNGEATLAAAIECILNQTYRDFEFIIINDGSTDGSLATAQSYAEKDARIRIIDQENTGLTRALQRGVEAAKGDYIARMDADDISLPHRFEKQMALLEANPDMVAVNVDVDHVRIDGTVEATARFRRDPRLLPLLLCFVNVVGGHGPMIYSRAAYHAAGGYDPEYNLAEDYDLWTRLIDRGPFGAVPEVLYRYTTGHESVSSLNTENQAIIAAKVAQRQFKKVTGTPIDEAVALGLYAYWRQDIPRNALPNVTWRTASALLLATRLFFDQRPELRHEKYETLRQLSARWWWITKSRYASFNPLLRLTFLANTVRLWLAARIAKARYGDAHRVLE